MRKILSTTFAVAAVLAPMVAQAVPLPYNYEAIVRANQKGLAEIQSILANCAPGQQAACQRDADKEMRAIQNRITRASTDPSLTPAVQRATSRQLTEILNRDQTCTNPTACAEANRKTVGSIVYRIQNQAPVSP